ncbi:hypothetical protein V6N13_063774 [Hibiscus sabdariffa]|uniref:Uncharacterized protein n=1 Tax=Hibiscus sabdariffa TaxID=183260 RepID=A0ABR2R1C5_9ROSI
MMNEILADFEAEQPANAAPSSPANSTTSSPTAITDSSSDSIATHASNSNSESETPARKFSFTNSVPSSFIILFQYGLNERLAWQPRQCRLPQ